MTSPLPSVRSVLTAHQHVREQVREWILSGAIPAGTRLRQAEIAERTGSSTTPVREALRELAAEGLVTMDAHRGAVVREIDFSEMSEIYELRCLLEPHAVGRSASRISNADLDAAEALIRTMEERDDPAQWAIGNRDFHAILVNAAGSERLSTMIKSLRDSAVLFVGSGVREDHNRMRNGDIEHQAIVDALRARDAKLAARLTREHLDGSLRSFGIEREEILEVRGTGVSEW